MIKQSIFDELKPIKEGFERLFGLALDEGLFKVQEFLNKDYYLSRYYNEISIGYSDNGLPSFSKNFSGSFDYSSCFSERDNINYINVEEIVNFINLREYIKENPVLFNRLYGDTALFKTTLHIMYSKAIDSYIHRNGSPKSNQKIRHDIIDEVANYIFDQELRIDILVPILFVKFEFDSFEIKNGIEIRRMSDVQHIARYNVESYNTSIHDVVKDSATHCLYLKNYKVNNNVQLFDLRALDDNRAYPLELINNFFGAIRIATEVETGYAQILALAQKWNFLPTRNLPNILGASIRAYPTWFENYYWNIEAIPSIGEEGMKKVSKIFCELLSNESNSIKIAIRRLNQCKTRENEEDIILDATIGLEALFSDNTPHEMTHKLAMRIAGAAKISNIFRKAPQEVFKDVKQIYGYRSAIVHGSSKASSKKVIKLSDKREILTNDLAIEYLRYSLFFLLNNPQYKTAQLIDSEILLSSNGLE